MSRLQRLRMCRLLSSAYPHRSLPACIPSRQAVVDLARGRLEMKGPEWLVGATLIVAGFALINK